MTTGGGLPVTPFTTQGGGMNVTLVRGTTVTMMIKRPQVALRLRARKILPKSTGWDKVLSHRQKGCGGNAACTPQHQNSTPHCTGSLRQKWVLPTTNSSIAVLKLGTCQEQTTQPCDAAEAGHAKQRARPQTRRPPFSLAAGTAASFTGN
jgi:hypothetical protein